MTPAMRGPSRMPLRVWWALPGLAVAGTAIGLAVVVGPTLGEQVTIPRQLVLPATVTAAAPTPAPTTGATPPVKPRPHHSPTPSVSPTPAGQPRTHVVTPRRPVVTSSGEDSQEHESGSDRSGVEIQGADG